mgnify:CR=1 FL=1
MYVGTRLISLLCPSYSNESVICAKSKQHRISRMFRLSRFSSNAKMVTRNTSKIEIPAKLFPTGTTASAIDTPWKCSDSRYQNRPRSCPSSSVKSRYGITKVALFFQPARAPRRHLDSLAPTLPSARGVRHVRGIAPRLSRASRHLSGRVLSSGVDQVALPLTRQLSHRRPSSLCRCAV